MIKDLNNIDPKELFNDERITAYLKGQLSSEEEQRFLNDLEADPKLKEKAIIIARLVRGMKQVGATLDHNIVDAFLASNKSGVKNVAKKVIEQERIPTQTTHHRSRRKLATWLSIAASIILIVWIGVDYYAYRSTTSLGKEYETIFSSSTIARGSATPSAEEKKLASLFDHVKSGENLDETIHDLEICWAISKMETLNDYTDVSAEIGWNLAIAHLKDNNKPAAKKVLSELVETTEEGSAIHTKAKELLNRL